MTAVLSDDRRSDIPTAELYSFLQDYPEHMLGCRAYGHDFRPVNRGRAGYEEDYDTERRVRVLLKRVPCKYACGVTRLERLHWIRGRWRELPRQDTEGVNYIYPEGYLLPEGWHISRIEVREFMAWREFKDK